MWRFIAVSTQEANSRYMRIRVVKSNKIKVYAAILNKTSTDIISDLSQEWNVVTNATQGKDAGNLAEVGSLIITNLTN